MARKKDDKHHGKTAKAPPTQRTRTVAAVLGVALLAVTTVLAGRYVPRA